MVEASSDPEVAAAAPRLEVVTFDLADAPASAAFWAPLLDREVVTESGAALVPGDETQVGLRVIASETERTAIKSPLGGTKI